MNTASDNVGVIYTGTAVTSKPMRIIGYAEWNASGVATAGTWTTTNMIVVRLFGPGVAAPGDIVQIQQTASATATNASATTAVTTTNSNEELHAKEHLQPRQGRSSRRLCRSIRRAWSRRPRYTKRVRLS